MTGSNPNERWILLTELGGILQLVSVLFLYQAGTFGGDLGSQIAVVGSAIVLVTIVYTITVYAVWQDMQTISQYSTVDVNDLLWITTVVFLPIVGTFGYIWTYGRTPTYRGMIGRLLSSFGNTEIDDTNMVIESDPEFDSTVGRTETSTHSESRTTTSSESNPESASSTDIDLDFGSSLNNQLPEVETQEHITSTSSSNIVRVTIPEYGITAVKKSPRNEQTISEIVINSYIHEAETWDRIDDHDHIVSVYGWGADPLPWILLENMPGGDFTDVIENQGIITTIKLLSQVCEGVYYGHERGVYHFDLKPSNILLDATREVAKVSDWGSAEVFMDHTDLPQELTPAYSSPELVDTDQSNEPSPQTDIFQIGILAYESLTGVHPFNRQSSTDCIEAIQHAEPEPPSELNPKLPAEIDQAIMKALEKDQDERHTTLIQFKNEIESTIRITQ